MNPTPITPDPEILCHTGCGKPATHSIPDPDDVTIIRPGDIIQAATVHLLTCEDHSQP